MPVVQPTPRPLILIKTGGALAKAQKIDDLALYEKMDKVGLNV